jgi:spore coat polysaccharide biosynthesis protein SpsF (cytidylyltransferase family)
MTNCNPGIVICTRLESSRLSNKAVLEIGDKKAIEILIERLLWGFEAKQICLAFPENDRDVFIPIADKYKIKWMCGSDDNVLERFYLAAKEFEYNPVVRISHDNILQFPSYILDALATYKTNLSGRLDYISLKNGIPGTKFEIISFGLVERAYKKYKDRKVELMTYPFKELAIGKYEYVLPIEPKVISNLAIDFPMDLCLHRIICEQNKFDFIGKQSFCSDLDQYVALCHYIRENPTLMNINHRPLISVYTCAFNAEKTIGRAIQSMIAQTFTDWEYIVYDDGSDDDTSKTIMQYACKNPNLIKIAGNSKRKGLAKSSNRVICNSRGKYILRLDADDELLPDALEIMIKKIKQHDSDILYADCWKIEEGQDYFDRYHFHDNEYENIGCALIKRDVWEEIKFRTDLEYCDGLDFYMRAREMFEIAEVGFPLWIYHQRPDSMSKTGGQKRAELKKKILEGNNHIVHWSNGAISCST